MASAGALLPAAALLKFVETPSASPVFFCCCFFFLGAASDVPSSSILLGSNITGISQGSLPAASVDADCWPEPLVPRSPPSKRPNKPTFLAATGSALTSGGSAPSFWLEVPLPPFEPCFPPSASASLIPSHDSCGAAPPPLCSAPCAFFFDGFFPSAATQLDTPSLAAALFCCFMCKSRCFSARRLRMLAMGTLHEGHGVLAPPSAE